MPIINEGNLQFTFPHNWRVIKYDETNFYRFKMEPLGVDLAAIDFLVIHRGNNANCLILIEVKDFRNHVVENRKRQTSGELAQEVLKKCVDTLSALYLASYTKDNNLVEYAEHPLEPLGMHNLLPIRLIDLILFMEEDYIPVAKKWRSGNQDTRINDITLQLKMG